MRKPTGIAILCIAILACSHNKNLSQSQVASSKDSLIQFINSSQSDTTVINPKLKQLQQENELVISFATLNYAWTRRGSFYVLTKQNNTWKAYRFDTRLPYTTEDAALNISPVETAASEAEKIKALYTKAQLWKTTGDNGDTFCAGKKNCNITDAETWTLSVATKNNMHTTTYYAPEFFEECCPGNKYRKEFIDISKAIMKTMQDTGTGTEK